MVEAALQYCIYTSVLFLQTLMVFMSWWCWPATSLPSACAWTRPCWCSRRRRL